VVVGEVVDGAVEGEFDKDVAGNGSVGLSEVLVDSVDPVDSVDTCRVARL
jgi:hypothetical protein